MGFEVYGLTGVGLGMGKDFHTVIRLHLSVLSEGGVHGSCTIE